jgi:hypothetical protein
MKSLEPVAIDEPPGVESLLDGELAVLVRFVRALVDRDEAALRDSGAYATAPTHTYSRATGVCGTTST